MSCGHCAHAVEDALPGVSGVVRVRQVELETGRVLVEGEADPQALSAAVEAAGYGAESAAK